MITVDKHLTKKLNELLKTCDALITELKAGELEKQEIFKEMIDLDKKGQKVDSQYARFKVLHQREFLLNQDITRVLYSIAILSEVSEVCGIKIELEDTEVERITRMRKENNPLFVVKGSKVTFFNPDVEASLKAETENLEKRDPNNINRFLESLRKNPLYTQETK